MGMGSDDINVGIRTINNYDEFKEIFIKYHDKGLNLIYDVRGKVFIYCDMSIIHYDVRNDMYDVALSYIDFDKPNIYIYIYIYIYG